MFTPRRHIARTQDATAKRRLQLKIYLLLLLILLLLLHQLVHLFMHFFHLILFFIVAKAGRQSPPAKSRAAFSRLCIINQFTFSLTTRKNEMQITATNRERCSIWGCRVGSPAHPTSTSRGTKGRGLNGARSTLRLRQRLCEWGKGNGAATRQQHHFSPQRFTRT